MEIIELGMVETQEAGEMPQAARPDGKLIQIVAWGLQRLVQNDRGSKFKTRQSLR